MYQIPYYEQYANYYNYSADYMNEYGMSTTKSQWAGSGYMALTAITFFMYARILTIIYFNKEINQLPSYRIVAHLGYCECLQLICLFIEGLFCATLNTFNHWIMKICIALLLYGLLCSAAFTILLTFNRFIQIIFHTYIDRFFSKSRTTLIIILCWLTAVPALILMLIPNLVKSTYQPYWLDEFYLQAGFVFSISAYNIISDKSLYVFCAFAFSMLIYTVIIISLIRQRGIISGTEIRMTLQTAISCGLTMAPLTWMQFSFANDVTIGVTQLIWIIIASFNPYIYLIFNRTLQSLFFPEFIRHKWNPNKVIPFVTVTTAK